MIISPPEFQSGAEGPTVAGRVCMLYQGEAPHAAHKAFGDAVEAEYRHFESADPIPSQDTNSIADRVATSKWLSEFGTFDTVIAEGTAPLQTLLSYKSYDPDIRAFYLAADETFYTLPNRPTQYLWKLIKPAANRLLNGVIAVGQDVYNWATPYLGKLPFKIVHPPISDSKYNLLADLPPTTAMDKFRILTVGNAQPSKNHHLLAAATQNLRSRYGDHIEAVFLGRDHQQQSYTDDEGIRTPGFVSLDEFQEWHRTASLYVQPSIGDSFPVASLEAMLAATPTVVTTGVGTRHLLPDDQVTAPDVSSLTVVLSRLYNRSPDERCEIGTYHRDQVVRLTELAQEQRFQDAIADLIQV